MATSGAFSQHECGRIGFESGGGDAGRQDSGWLDPASRYRKPPVIRRDPVEVGLPHPVPDRYRVRCRERRRARREHRDDLSVMDRTAAEPVAFGFVPNPLDPVKRFIEMKAFTRPSRSSRALDDGLASRRDQIGSDSGGRSCDASCSAGRTSGTVKKNVLPAPTWLSTQIWPP